MMGAGCLRRHGVPIFTILVNSAGTTSDAASGLSSGPLSGTLGRLLGSIFERFVQVFRVTYPVCAA